MPLFLYISDQFELAKRIVATIYEMDIILLCLVN